MAVAAATQRIPGTSLQIHLVAGTATISNLVGTSATISISGSAFYDGDYPVDLSGIETAPIILAGPAWTTSGGIEVDDVLTAVPPLAVASVDAGPAPIGTPSWKRAGAEVGTASEHIVGAGDISGGLTLNVTLSWGEGYSVSSENVEVIGAAIPVVSGTAGGPTETSDATYDYYEFTASGSITFSAGGLLAVELTGGGGGGGGGHFSRGGGGGAGAVVLAENVEVAGTSYTVTVGAAGTGGISTSSAATRGGDSTAFSITAEGGGSGQTSGSVPADISIMNGGCGGGAAGFGSLLGGAGDPGGDGGDGAGNSPGGGGGMGGVGGNGVHNANGGAPGMAIQSTLDGTWLAEGGEAGRYNAPGGVSHGGGEGGNSANGSNGADGTGSGGGGAGGGSHRNGGDGGAGRVLIRIPKVA